MGRRIGAIDDARGASESAKRERRSSAWPVLIAIAALSLAGVLLYRTLSRYNLDQLVASVTAIPLARLPMAGGFAAASYLCLTGFEYLALRYAGRPLPYRKAALASFTSL